MSSCLRTWPIEKNPSEDRLPPKGPVAREKEKGLQVQRSRCCGGGRGGPLLLCEEVDKYDFMGSWRLSGYYYFSLSLSLSLSFCFVFELFCNVRLGALRSLVVVLN